MPVTYLPPDLKPVVSEFLKGQKEFNAAAEGKWLVKSISSFARVAISVGVNEVYSGKFADVARQTVEWINRIPEKIVTHAASPLINFKDLGEKEAVLAVSSGLQVLVTGVQAFLAGKASGRKLDADVLLHAAFGADPASIAIRKPFIDPKFEWPRQVGSWALPNIDKLVRYGTIKEYLETLAACGISAQVTRTWIGNVKPIGAVSVVSPSRACGGDRLRISYKEFGNAPPAASVCADIVISIPTADGSCRYISIREIEPDFFAPATWRDSGQLTLTLPANVTTGCIGFFILPPPEQTGSPCGPGTLVAAAGMLQSVLADQFGAQGVMIGQIIYNSATKVEAGNHMSLPCAGCQIDNANHLNAGPPIIHTFRVVESGPVYPRGYVTLSWSVANAEHIEIVSASVQGSENPHELPAISGPVGPSGTMHVTIPCSKRWIGQYALRASNANGCLATPMESVVTLNSGYSEYRVGVAKMDITDSRAGLGMAGFAYEQQITTGNVQLPLFARAFVIEENSAAPNRKRVAFVVADIWTCTQAVKTAVVKRLNQIYSGPRYSVETVMIGGTHTHAGPGGYSEYHLYNLTINGFDQQVFDTIVNGIVAAISNADVTASPGRIFVNAAELEGCGGNRSFDAYKRNPEYVVGSGPEIWTDREMLLLKFVRDIDSFGNTEGIGALNWYAIHATSLGMKNTDVSGDNKGWAESLFESHMAAKNQGFVAAFGNGNAGDVSGNVTLDRNGNKTVTMPLGGPADLGLLDQDTRRMQKIGDQQFQTALELYDTATREVTGSIRTSYTHVDMSNVVINNLPGAQTWPAAIGVSFGAGSSEDSIAYATIDLPGLGKTDIDAGIIEGMSQGEYLAGGIEAWGIIVLMTLPVAAAISLVMLTGAPLGIIILPAVLEAIPFIALPHARSYIASKIASAMFAGKVMPSAPLAEDTRDTWSWNVPELDAAPADYIAGHGSKPIMFPVGISSLTFTPGPNSTQPARTVACPLVPHVLPIQLIKIGQVAVAGVPAEFTSTAGRRLKATVSAVLGNSISHIAISNYTNAYSGYVTTLEEYGAQHYEGASTLYGPYTLAAYQQEFEKLANAINTGVSTPVGSPAIVPAVFKKR